MVRSTQLGGEIIRQRYEDPKLKKMSARRSIEESLDPDGGPLLWPRITEEAQDSLDATCRKLYKYLNSTSAPAPQPQTHQQIPPRSHLWQRQPEESAQIWRVGIAGNFVDSP